MISTLEYVPQGEEALILILADLGTDYRCFKIAGSLRRLGYRPTVLCDQPLHPLGPSWDGITVRPLTGRSHFQGFLRAFAVYLWRVTFILATTRSRLWIVEDLPPLLPAALLGRLRGATVVYDSREIILETPMVKQRFLRRLFWTAWHWAGLALVSRMFAVSPLSVGYFRARYPAKQIWMLPNAPPASERAISKPALSEGIQVIFQGAFRVGTGLPEAIRAVASSSRYHLHIYGYGAEEEAIRRLIETLGADGRIKLMAPVPFEMLPPLIAQAHIGLHLMQPTCLNTDYTLSNKVFDYLHGETPVLLGPTSANRDLVERHRVGVIVPTLSEQDILAGLDALVADWDAYRLGCREAARVWNWDAYEPDLARAVKPL